MNNGMLLALIGIVVAASLVSLIVLIGAPFFGLAYMFGNQVAVSAFIAFLIIVVVIVRIIWRYLDNEREADR